ncbi:MAG: TIGR03620 family F420-dependent LLM class oxidoreductase [Rhodospirillaceae bacterium]|nr:TIGR03620 family F420-dependent LLM class oxidoreductase [Rhodospirillaceae bacterium]
MKDIGRLGVWIFPDALSTGEIVELAKGVERLGYDTLWYPEGIGYETFSFGGFVLSATERLRAASGIANIYARDAVTAIAGHDSLNRLYDDRFILGLGVSHIPLVEGFRGHNYGKPVASMRAYLDGMEAAELSISAPERNIVLAALGPNMLALARERTKGAHPYLVTPEHTARARKIVGPDKWLCVEQKICLTEDAAQALEIAANVLELYLAWPNYRNNWLSLGFSEEELSGRGSDRFLDAMVASGSAQEVRARLQAHFDAGANHVCVQPLNPDGSAAVDWKALEAVATL